MELNRVRARKWNSNRVIVFRSVILQHAKGVNNSNHIRTRIFFKLDFWNRGAFDKLVKDTFNAAMKYLGKYRGIKTEGQHHRTFSNLVLKRKIARGSPLFI